MSDLRLARKVKVINLIFLVFRNDVDCDRLGTKAFSLKLDFKRANGLEPEGVWVVSDVSLEIDSLVGIKKRGERFAEGAKRDIGDGELDLKILTDLHGVGMSLGFQNDGVVCHREREGGKKQEKDEAKMRDQ